MQKCLLCGGGAVLKMVNKRGFQMPQTFQIWHCEDCNTAFALPKVNTDNLYELIYKNSEILSSDYLEWFDNVIRKRKPLTYLISKSLLFWSINHVLKKKKISKKDALLEVGSGLGYLTYALRKAGYNATGLDISNVAVEKAKQYLGNFYFQADVLLYADQHPESFDVILLTEVIEHVDEPLTFMKALAKLLKTDGCIILTTPNKSFYPKEAVWSSANPPMHLWWFSEDSMQYIAKQLNLTVEFLDYSESYQARMAKNYSLKPFDKPYTLDQNGNPINNTPIQQKRAGMLPPWFKETYLYQIVSQTVYPIIAKFYPKRKRIYGMCAIFCKN
jgi:2-polyprenyl-3-methyl-5-hydroxy-6-metoxy-1,4-benzoquinol methylase